MNFKLISTNKNWIESEALDQAKKLCQLKDVKEVIGFPDLHPGRVPVGVATVTENRIYPHLIGNDIGCGMSFYKIDFETRKFKSEKVARLLKEYAFAKEKIAPNETFETSLGTIGSGNHFAEFQQVKEIVNEDLAKKYLLDKKMLYALVHSGSRGYGQKIFSDLFDIENMSKGFVEDSKDYEVYMKEHDSAIVWASKNRDLILENILLNSGLRSNSLKISESNHNNIDKLNINGKNIFIHRKGASEAKQNPVIIPGSRDSFSYLVMPTEKCADSYFSVAHGAGRRWNKKLCKARLFNKYSKNATVTEKHKSKIIYKDTDLIFEEAPEGYKNINEVINSLTEEGIIQVIAILKPLLTFKG